MQRASWATSDCRAAVRSAAGLAIVGLLVGTASGAASTATAALPGSERVGSGGAAAVLALAELPLFFEANEGQVGGEARFLARAPGFVLKLAPSELWLTVRSSATAGRGVGGGLALEDAGDAVRLRWLGANPVAEGEGEGELPGKVSYLRGNDPRQWHTEVPTYERVRVRDLYPGVDIVYYGHGRELEYDLVVAPGADPALLTLRIEGARPRAAESGDLALAFASGGELGLRAPLAFQERAGERMVIASGYRIEQRDGGADVRFVLGRYDPTLPLVIDPLVYSTFLAGNEQDAAGISIAVNAAGEAFVAGVTDDGTGWPTTPGAFDPSANAGEECFVAKLDAAGSALVYLTFVGGSSNDSCSDLALNAAGEVFLVGSTTSADFPITPGAYDASHNGGTDLFVARLDSSGSSLVYSTFVGAAGFDTGTAIALLGNDAFVAALTNSASFPVTAGAFDTTINGQTDTVVLRLDGSGANLLYSTLLGGADTDTPGDLAVSPAGEVYVTGATNSTNYPTTPGAYDPTDNPGSDVFVTRLSSAGSSLVYSTLIGNGYGRAIALNAAGEAFLAGFALDAGFPITAGALDGTFGAPREGFLTRLDAAGTNLVYSTFLGGSADEEAFDLALLGDEAVVVGETQSADFPTTPGAEDTTFNGDRDAFVTRVNSSGSAALYSTYLGGASFDRGIGVAVTGLGEVFATGLAGVGFPATAGAFDPVPSGGSDVFVAKLTTGASSAPLANLIVSKTDNLTTAVAGQTIRYVIGVGNGGTANAQATVRDSFGAALTNVSWSCSSSDGGACSPAGAGDIDDLATLPAGSTVVYLVTATLAPNAVGMLSNTATATPLAGVVDPFPLDNAATDTTEIVARSVVEVPALSPGGALAFVALLGAAALALLARRLR